MDSAEDIIRRFALQPHPEGGHYRETHRDFGLGGARGAVTSIYYLPAAGERSHWHKVDAVKSGATTRVTASSLAFPAMASVPGPCYWERERIKRRR